MSNILDRLKNLENERPSVLRTAEPVLPRSYNSSQKTSSRKRVAFLFVAILVASSGLAYKFKHLILPNHQVAAAPVIDLTLAENQQNDRAVASYKKGDYNKSVEALEALVKAHPERAEFHVNLAMAYLQLSKFDKAEEQLKLAIALDPKNSVAHNNLGLIARQTKQEQLAEKSFTQAYELDSKSPEITLNLASHYEKTGQLKKSAEFYQRYIGLPNADRANVELLKKRIPRLNSLAAQTARFNEEEGT